MNKTFNRALTLLLALCLTLPLASVIPVQAETENTATLTVEYPFYNPVLNATEGSFAEMQTNGVIKSELTGSYPQSTNNVLYAYYTSNGAKPRMANNYVNGSTTYTPQVMYWCYVGDWLAFKVQSPGNGKYNISLTFFRDASSAKECSVYVLDKSTAADDIANNLNSDTLLNTVNLNNSKGSPASLGVRQFAENDECILVFKSTEPYDSTKTVGRMNLIGLTMTPVYATVDGVDFTDESEAISKIKAASADAEVKITNKLQLSDNLDTAAAITVNDGAVLNLNGNDLSAKAVTCNGSGIVKDSKDGTGTLAVENAKLNTNGQLPLKDTAGYHFFNVTVEKLGITGKVMNGQALSAGKFWFHISFTNATAYALANEQMTIGAGLSGTGIPTDTNAWASPEFTAAWVTAVNGNAASDICFSAKNLDYISDFKLTPVVKANDVTVSGAAL